MDTEKNMVGNCKTLQSYFLFLFQFFFFFLVTILHFIVFIVVLKNIEIFLNYDFNRFSSGFIVIYYLYTENKNEKKKIIYPNIVNFSIQCLFTFLFFLFTCKNLIFIRLLIIFYKKLKPNK